MSDRPVLRFAFERGARPQRLPPTGEAEILC